MTKKKAETVIKELYPFPYKIRVREQLLKMLANASSDNAISRVLAKAREEL